MKLEGSCHCSAVRFTVESDTPYPYNRCYCRICRKTAGGGGYAINIMGDASTLTVEGEEHISIYRSAINDRGVYEEDGMSQARRHFCSLCGSALWVYGPDHPDWIYPLCLGDRHSLALAAGNDTSHACTQGALGSPEGGWQ